MTMQDIKDAVGTPANYRVAVIAIVCLTAIAGAVTFVLKDPENIIVNIVVAIGALSNLGSSRKNDDKPKE
jgi:hypothetical protein